VILPDTSCWIHWIRHPDRLDGAEPRFQEFLTCGPILQEVLQGLDHSPFAGQVREAMLAIPRIGDPLELKMFLGAADIYKEGRRRGYTIRSATDCLIAALALGHGATVWHKDRDFTDIARYTPLRATSV
jgi:predicted nucleic acid-binding protein